MKTSSILKTGTVALLLSYSFVSIGEAHAPKQDNNKKAIATQKQLICLAQVIYDEARGEPKQGKYAVAHVVQNRVKTWDRDTCGVVYHKRGKICQFSGMCSNGEKPYTDETMRIAYNVYTGQHADNTKGATYFHANYVKPKWMNVYERTIIIAKHHFYKSNQTL